MAGMDGHEETTQRTIVFETALALGWSLLAMIAWTG
jgi:hypothetical protein